MKVLTWAKEIKKKILLGLSLWNKVLFLFNEISGKGGSKGVNFTSKLLITREWRTAGNCVFFCPESGPAVYISLRLLIYFLGAYRVNTH